MTTERRPGTKYGSMHITMIDREAEGGDEASETSPLVGGSNDGDGNGADDDEEQRKDATPVDDFHGLPWWRRPSVYWLIGPYCLFSLAFGGILVPRLDLIVDLVCHQYFADRKLVDPDFTFKPVIMGAENPQCNSAVIQKNVAAFTLILSALTGGLSAITAPKLGALSDRFGRKRLMVISSFGGVLNEVITILAAKYPESVDYHWMILGAFFDGIAGSFTAGSVLGMSYTSDCTEPSKRGVKIGYLHSCLFAGLAFGPLLAGYFVKLTGSLVSVFYLVLGCHLVVIGYYWFILPESLSKKRQTLAREKHKSDRETMEAALPETLIRTFGPRLSGFFTDYTGTWLAVVLTSNPLAPLKILVPSGRHNAALRRNMVLLALIDGIVMASAMGASTVIVLYSKYMFNWGTLEASRFVSIIFLARVFILLGTLPLLTYIFRIRPMRRRQQEEQRVRDQQGSGSVHVVETNSGADNLDVWLLRFALVSDAAGLAGYIFVRRQELFILCGIITAFGGLAGATIQSAVTKHVPAERTGALLGAMGLLHALGRVFGPMFFNGIYAATIESFPQAFFVVIASLFGLAILGSLFVRPHVYLKEDGYVRVPTREEGDPNTVDAMANEEITIEALPTL
ncbi:MFS general substrate transporter [Xylariomycetidae sp. FL0641]|nr:MFS general substrate transporter [Xylariomycetidae sp. FL0641]